MNPKNHYTERLSLTKGQLQQVKKQIFRISMLRLTLFIAGVAGIYFFFSQTPLLIVCICLTFLPLFILVKIHNRFLSAKNGWKHRHVSYKKSCKPFPVITVLLRTGKNTSIRSIPIHSTWIYSGDAPVQSINRTCTFSEKTVWQNGCKTICTKNFHRKTAGNGTGNKRTYLVPRTVPRGRTGAPRPVIRC